MAQEREKPVVIVRRYQRPDYLDRLRCEFLIKMQRTTIPADLGRQKDRPTGAAASFFDGLAAPLLGMNGTSIYIRIVPKLRYIPFVLR